MKLSERIECIIWAFDRSDSRRNDIRKLAREVAELEEKVERLEQQIQNGTTNGKEE